jgi:serine/threonine-protein kinase
VTNEGDDIVAAISGRTNTITARIAVGRFPVGVAANPKTNTAYVGNAVDNTVSVLTSCRR